MNITDQLNTKTWNDTSVIEKYKEWHTEYPPEKRIFDNIYPKIKGRRILDIGIGGGRTTEILLKITDKYTGIDYSEEFVKRAREKYKTVNFYHCDARDLGIFPDNSFELVVFSLNGLDYVNHSDRIKIMAEIHRVLIPGGYFTFSTHNMSCQTFNQQPWQENRQLNWIHLKTCLRAMIFVPRHLKMKKFETYHDNYAIINDTAHDYSLLTYYIPYQKQLEQLQESGFSNVEAYTLMGNVVTEDNTESEWLFYLCEKI